MLTRILSGDEERIQTPAVKDGSLAALTGLTTVLLSIQRTSDGFWYDFNDDTFKSTGWTTRQQQMTEVSSTLAAGEYYFDWDTSQITNETADDTYMIRVDESGGTAKNVPFHGEIKIDQWVKDLFDEHDDTQSDIAALNDLSQADVQAAMTSQGYTAARAPNLDNLDAAVSSRATQADILSDATPFAGANIDATISSRSDFDETTDPVELLDSGGGAGTSAAELVADVESQLSGTHGVGSWEGDSGLTAQEVRDAMKLAPTGGAPAAGSVDEHLDDIATDTAAIDGRLPADPADESNQNAQHATTQADIAALNDLSQADILSDATPFAGANIDVAISSRSNHTPADVDTTLTGTHGAGSWQSGGTPLTQQEVRDAMKLAPTGGAPAGGSVDEHLNDILTDTAVMEPLISTNVDVLISSRATQADILSDATPFAGANIDATISSRSSHSAADVDTVLTGTHGAGSWQTGGATLTPQDIRDAMKLAPTGGAPAVGSVDEHLDDILVDTSAIDGRLPADPADESNQLAQHAATQADIAALNDISQADVQAAMTAQGYTVARGARLDNLDALISSRSSHDAADVDTVLTAAHGVGSWQQSASLADWTAAERQQIRDALGVDGAKNAATGGQLQDVLADTAAMEPVVSTNLDATITSVLAAVAALNDLSIADIQTAMDNQGYTTVRAVNLDFLDIAVSSRSSHTPTDVDTLLSSIHGPGSWESEYGMKLTEM